MNDTYPSEYQHLLDKKADTLAGLTTGNSDDLLTTQQMMEWFNYSKQWFEIGRCKGYGPPFIKMGWRIRYRRDAVLKWLDQRLYQSTAEYELPGQRRAGSSGPKKKAEPVKPRIKRLSDPV